MGWSWSWLYGSYIYNYLCNQCISPLTLWVWIPLRRGVLDTCDSVCQWLATGRWFSPGTPVTSTTKTDRHDMTEILLKVALNIITLIQTTAVSTHLSNIMYIYKVLVMHIIISLMTKQLINYVSKRADWICGLIICKVHIGPDKYDTFLDYLSSYLICRIVDINTSVSLFASKPTYQAVFLFKIVLI